MTPPAPRIIAPDAVIPALVADTDQGYWGAVYGYDGVAPYWGRMGMRYL